MWLCAKLCTNGKKKNNKKKKMVRLRSKILLNLIRNSINAKPKFTSTS